MNDKKEKEILKDLLSEMEEAELKLKKVSGSRKWFRLFTSLTLTLAIFGLAGTILIYINDQKDLPELYFSKQIQSDIQTVIQKEADVSTVKHIYNSRVIKKKNILDLFNKKEESFYPETTTLSHILSDLKVSYYKDSNVDSCYLKALEKIIETHNQINPFDKLEPNQKFAFENVRTKLDDNYSIVQGDFNRIADELNNKNQLVGKYLEKSNLSYWISIIALGLTIVLSTVQIYQNRNSKKVSELVSQLFIKDTSKK